MKFLPGSVFFLMITVLVAGCGSSFEWFPSDGSATDPANGSSSGTTPGTVMREFPFPTAHVAIRSVSDIAYDKNTLSFWLLAETSSSPTNTPNVLVQISAVTGSYSGRVDASFWPFEIMNGSTVVYDTSSFWIAGSDGSGGKVYQIFSTGLYKNKFYDCPATDTVSGFCQGLAFDPATLSYWSAGSDNTNLVNYQLADGSVTSAQSYSSIWSTNGVSDVAFDSASGEVFVVKDGIIRVNKSSGAYLGSIPFTLPGSGRGDWDGQYFWAVDNGSKSIKALFVR